MEVKPQKFPPLIRKLMNDTHISNADTNRRYRFSAFIVSAILILNTQSRADAGDWVSFRGNPQLTGVAAGDFPDNPQLLWTFEAGEGIESTAAIAAGTVYAGALDGNLYAINLESGSLKWKYSASDEIKSSPAVFRKTVYFGDEMGVFHAVDAETGQQRWIFQTDGGIISSANFAGDSVLFGSYDQYLYCVSAETGALIWKFETEGYVHGTPTVVDVRSSGSLPYPNDVVVTTGCDGYLRVINVLNGEENNKIPLGDYVAASPAVLKTRAFVGTFGNQVLGVDLNHAEILWNYEPAKGGFPFYASAAVTNDAVIVGGRDKRIHALKPQTGEPLWIYPTKARVDSSPVIIGNRVLFGTVGGVIYALNINTGEPVWQFVTGSSIVASPCVAGGKLVIGSDDGVLYCFGGGTRSNE